MFAIYTRERSRSIISSISSSSLPAGPTNGSPCRSSCSPGPSPMNISSLSGSPTPKTTLCRPCESGQSRQERHSLCSLSIASMIITLHIEACYHASIEKATPDSLSRSWRYFFLIRTTGMTAARISDAGMEQITPSSPNQTGSSERQPPKKQSGGTVKPVPPLALLKRQPPALPVVVFLTMQRETPRGVSLWGCGYIKRGGNITL